MMNLARSLRGLLACVLLATFAGQAAEPEKLEPQYPFRTDTSNAKLPWYQLKSAEFPPRNSEHRIEGELLEADFLHRTGVFRNLQSGELVNFSLPPYGTVLYLNTDADLRDVPLGTHFQFFLYQDENSAFTKAAVMQDTFTADAVAGNVYRLKDIKAGEKTLLVVSHKLNENPADTNTLSLKVSDKTRIWKGDKQIKLEELAVSDELLVNFSGNADAVSRYCSDIWVGAETHKLITEQVRKKHNEFLKARGLAAWIEKIDGKKLTVAFFGSALPSGLPALFKDSGIVTTQYVKEGRNVGTAVANEELRTYNPPVDKQGSKVLAAENVTPVGYGFSGERWVIEVSLMLEGFRKGRVVRIFAHSSWPVHDMSFGESLYSERPGVKSEEFNPYEFPYRTDFANESQPWYQLKPTEFPPTYSEHSVNGELLKVDAVHRSGQFRMDRSGVLVDFTLLPFGSVSYLNAGAELEDVPLGTRMTFLLHQDAKGEFTKATGIQDDFTRQVSNKITYRLDAARLDEGRLWVSRQIPPIENDLGHMVKPPDFGSQVLQINEKTCVWKGDKQIQLGELAAGDELLVNLSGRTTTNLGYCTNIWVGADTHKLVTEKQKTKHNDFCKERGMPGWIEKIDGKKLTVAFFAGSAELLNGDANGKSLFVKLANEELLAAGSAPDKMAFRSRVPNTSATGLNGFSGVRWVMEPDKLPESYKQGQVIRVFKEDWLKKDAPPAK